MKVLPLCLVAEPFDGPGEIRCKRTWKHPACYCIDVKYIVYIYTCIACVHMTCNDSFVYTFADIFYEHYILYNIVS